MTSVQELMSLGENIGLEGAELRSFITEQQSLEREERTKEREFQSEKLRLARAGSEFGGDNDCLLYTSDAADE